MQNRTLESQSMTSRLMTSQICDNSSTICSTHLKKQSCSSHCLQCFLHVWFSIYTQWRSHIHFSQQLSSSRTESHEETQSHRWNCSRSQKLFSINNSSIMKTHFEAENMLQWDTKEISLIPELWISYCNNRFFEWKKYLAFWITIFIFRFRFYLLEE